MASHTHLIVGAGRMGGALISGWLANKLLPPSKLIVLDPHPGAQAQTAIKKGVLHLSQPNAQLKDVDTVILAIKPQMFGELGAALAPFIADKALVISILAGTSLESLQNCFNAAAIIRAMPNTPAAIGAGITAFCAGKDVTKAQKKQAEKLLAAAGEVFEVENEHMIDIVTAVSGSGPAYVFYMVEALEAAAIKAGLPEDIAPAFARQTIIGSGALLAKSPESAMELRRAVTSPNGTTQAALDVLMDANGLAVLMRETVKAALKRAKELAQN